MTDGQKTKLGMAIEPDIAAEAEARMLAGRAPDPQANWPEGPGLQTRDVVAKKIGINSGSTYRRHKDLLNALQREEDGPQLIQHVASGDWDMDDVRRVVRTRNAARRVSVYVLKRRGELLPPPVRGNPQRTNQYTAPAISSQEEIAKKPKQQRILTFNPESQKR